jgi:hypothetical protein
MDRKWRITIVIAALFWVSVSLPGSAPFTSRAEAVSRFIPLDCGDPDDVYWGPSPLPTGADLGAQAADRPAKPDLVHGQEHECIALIARVLSLIFFRP